MFKPLLRTIPTVSGNIKLVCLLENFNKVDNNRHECHVRHGMLAPLSSKLFTRYIPISLLNSSWEWDVKTFYSYYREYFWDVIFNFNKTDLQQFNKHSINLGHNVDFEFGAKRISYQKNGYQYGFYAPIYLDNVKDIPDLFRIKLNINSGIYSTVKYIDVNIGKNSYDSSNYLYNYIYQYVNKINSDMIFMLPKSYQANYYGIDVKNGGFASITDNVISKLYLKQNTIHNFDNVICSGFKRNNLMIKQVLPLCFYFNVNDILNEEELNKFINAEINISGLWLKNNDEVTFYDWDTNYDTLMLNVLSYNEKTGLMDYSYPENYKNIMNIGYPSINEGRYLNYRLSNKFTKTFFRWKLKYSTDDNPYIMNISPAFSLWQNSQNRYGQFPEISDLMTGIVINSDENSLLYNKNNSYYNNLILPVNNNDLINKIYYSPAETGKYIQIRNCYLSDWFELVDFNNIMIDDLISSNYFVNVIDNKVLFNGILYSFDNMLNTISLDKNVSIDKFAVLFTLNYQPITMENLSLIKYSDFSFTLNNELFYKFNAKELNANVNLLYIDNGLRYQLYDNNITDNTHIGSTNDVFIYNDSHNGDYINIIDYGLDYYDINLLYRVKDVNNVILSDEFTQIIIDFLTYKQKSIIHEVYHKENDYAHESEKLTDDEIDNVVKNIINNNTAYNHQLLNRYIITPIIYDYIQYNNLRSFFVNIINNILNNCDTKLKLYKFLPIYYLEQIYEQYNSYKDVNITFLDKDLSKFNQKHELEYLNKIYSFDKLMLYYSNNENFIFKKINEYNDIENLITLYNKDNPNIYLFQLMNFYSKQYIYDLLTTILRSIYKQYIIADYKEEEFQYYIDKLYKCIYNNVKNKYKYTTEKLNNNSDQTLIAKNVVELIGEYPGKFYGDNIKYNKLNEDYDVIYVDPYNLNQIIDEFNTNNNSNCSYLIDDNYMYNKYVGNYIQLDDMNGLDYYALFFNKLHAKYYISKLYNNANNNKQNIYNYDSYSVFDTIYIRMKMVFFDLYDYKFINESAINSSELDVDIEISDMYIPLTEYFIIDRNKFIYEIYEEIFNLIESTNVDNVVAKNNLFYFNNYISLKKYLYDNKNNNLISEKVFNAIDIESLNRYLKFNFNEVIDDSWFDEITSEDVTTNTIITYKLKTTKLKYFINENYLDKHLLNLLNTTLFKPEYNKLFSFNLCFKRHFIKLNNELMNIINIKGKKSNYVDLLLYQFENPDYYRDSNNVSNNLHVYFLDTSENNIDNINIDKYMSHNNVCLNPLYNTIYNEDMEDSLIYCEYKVENINTVSILNYPTNSAIKNLYRNKKNNITCMLDISTLKDNNSYICINDIKYYSYSYYVDNFEKLFNKEKIEELRNLYPIYDIKDINTNLHKYCYLTCNDISGDYEYKNITSTNDIINMYNNKFTYVYKIGDVKYSYINNTYDMFNIISIEYDQPKTYSYVVSYEFERNNYITYTEKQYTYYDKASFDNAAIINPDILNSYEYIYNSKLLSYIYAVYDYSEFNILNNTYTETTYEIKVNVLDDLSLYDTFKLNTYNYDNNDGTYTTYAFLCVKLNFNNTFNSLNLKDISRKGKVNYITHVDDNNIVDIKRNNIYKVFDAITPFLKLNIFEHFIKLDNNNFILQPSRINIPLNYKSINYIYNGKDTGFYDIKFIEKSNVSIVLFRYFGMIEPILNPCYSVELYSLKYKNINKSFNYKQIYPEDNNYINEIYDKQQCGLYEYPGIVVYNNDSSFIHKDYEYKYFNDSKITNLKEEIVIDYDQYVDLSTLLYLQTKEKTYEIFKNYILNNMHKLYNINTINDEILFLFNKYSIQYLTNSDELFFDKSKQRYKLTYKFNLL